MTDAKSRSHTTPLTDNEYEFVALFKALSSDKQSRLIMQMNAIEQKEVQPGAFCT